MRIAWHRSGWFENASPSNALTHDGAAVLTRAMTRGP